MSKWTYRAFISIPKEYQDLANLIAKAMDPDVGGSNSFDTIKAGPTSGTYTHVVCDTTLTEETANTWKAIISATANVFYGAVKTAYDTRWPSDTAPSLADCMLFLDKSKIVVELKDEHSIDELLNPLVRYIEAIEL